MESKTEIRESIRRFILDSFMFDADSDHQLQDNLSLIDEGILDSFGVQEMLFFLEREFEITIQDEEAVPANLGSVEAMVAFVKTKQNGASSSA